eukprot:9545522-Alexandrium_andersonii.AAC.1
MLNAATTGQAVCPNSSLPCKALRASMVARRPSLSGGTVAQVARPRAMRHAACASDKAPRGQSQATCASPSS